MKIKKICLMATVESSMTSFILPVAYKFRENGHDVTVACNMSDTFYDTYKETFRCQRLNIQRGMHILNLIGTIFSLIRFFRREKFDLISYGTENMAFCASIAGRIAGIPVRIYDHWGALYVGYHGLMRSLTKWIEKTASRHSTAIRQVSRRNAETCVKEGLYRADKVKVLGLGGTVGVDLARFDFAKKDEYRREIRETYKLDDDAFVYGFLGRIQRDKGINELLEAFRAIHAEDANTRLLLTGPMDECNAPDAALMAWARQEESVIFAGKTSEVHKYVCAFDTLVHPTYREGFGMVLQEAGAMRVPIITSDIMGPAEFITTEENGLLVPMKDAVALTEAMRRMKNDAMMRERLADAVYTHTVTQFERSVMVERIYEDRVQLMQEKERT